MFKIKSKILKKLSAGFMAGLCAFSMLGSSVSGAITANAASTSTENSAFPSSDTVIAKAATLLGTPYTFGNKGYWYAYNQGQYTPLSVQTINNLGIDCSGLVYYTLTQLGAMDRDAYITAQERLGGTMYVTVGNYSYDTNGVLGNGVRNDTTGQTEDRSVLNGYNSNGYLGEKNDGTKGNDGANGKNIVFVGGTITSGATGYEDIDHIGTSLLLAVPAYTHVTFQGTAFKNVISIDYQLYTGPWSQLGCVDFEGCTFDGIIVGAMATQSLVFNNCTFNNYTNTSKANNSNPTWIRPA